VWHKNNNTVIVRSKRLCAAAFAAKSNAPDLFSLLPLTCLKKGEIP
jgi:hypothetical protein